MSEIFLSAQLWKLLLFSISPQCCMSVVCQLTCAMEDVYPSVYTESIPCHSHFS